MGRDNGRERATGRPPEGAGGPNDNGLFEDEPTPSLTSATNASVLLVRPPNKPWPVTTRSVGRMNGHLTTLFYENANRDHIFLCTL